MKNMIHELYAGNITPCDRQPSEEYTALNEEFATACSKFLPQLTDEQWPEIGRASCRERVYVSV